MDCQISNSGDVADVVLIGSLDSSWSPYLADRLDEVIRTGAREIRIDMSGISYLSSNGIALLVQYHRQMRQIGGAIRIASASEAIARVLDLTGVAKLLRHDGPVAAGRATSAPASVTLDRAGATLQVFGQASATAPGSLGLMGDPTKLIGGGYGRADERAWFAKPNRVALGLGALGPDFEACRDRYGEFLAVSGLAAYCPSAGSGRPDFEQASGAFVPEVHVLYGVSFAVHSGATLVRFEANQGPETGSIALSELARTCLDVSDAETVGVVLVGETAGLVGAALRRSPVEIPAGTDLFARAQARDWLSMTPEPEHARSTALAVGVATRSPDSALAPFVRPLSHSGTCELQGHFHAAVVPFRPLPYGAMEIDTAVRHLFDAGRVEAVLHLLNDARPIVGAGESTFRRGAFWFVPLSLDA